MSLLCAFLKMIWWHHRLKVAVWRQVIYPVTLVIQPKWLFSAQSNNSASLLFHTWKRFALHSLRWTWDWGWRRNSGSFSRKWIRSRTYRSDINQLEEQLAEKKQLSDAIKKRQQRTIANAEAVKQLSVAEVALKQSRKKLGADQPPGETGGARHNLPQSAAADRTGSRSNSEELKASQRDRMQRQLDEQKAKFRKQLQTVSELWRARALQSAEKRRRRSSRRVTMRRLVINKRETQKIRKRSSGFVEIEDISPAHP